MSIKAKRLLIAYIIIALLDVGGARIYQEWRYHYGGGGYLMLDFGSMAFFLAFTLLYAIAWYREVERRQEKGTWRFFVITALVLFFMSILIAWGCSLWIG